MRIYKKWVIILIFGLIISNYKMVAYAQEQNVLYSITTEESGEAQEGNADNLIEKDSQNTLGMVRDTLGAIFIEIVGAGLGFLSAIAFANRSNKQQQKELDASLRKELENIYEELQGRLKDDGVVEFYRYQTTIWDINLASGALALVANSKIYNKYIEIYSKIQYAQELEKEYLHAKLFANRDDSNDFVIKYVKTIDEARLREAKSICTQIEKIKLKENDECQEKS